MRERIALHLPLCAAIFLLPFLRHPAGLLQPAPWLALSVSMTVLLSQPRLRLREAASHSAIDRGSALAIFLSMVAAQVVASLDAANAAGHGAAPGNWFLPGATLAVAGLALRVWAIRTLGRFFTSTVVVVADQAVVRSGPYRILRHPSYTGALLAAFGTTMALGSANGMALVLGLCVPAYLYRIAIEERALTSQLGEAYRSYREGTWGLVPGVR